MTSGIGGMAQVLRRLNNIAKNLDPKSDIVDEAMYTGALVLEDAARDYAARDTSAMAESVYVATAKRNGYQVAVGLARRLNPQGTDRGVASPPRPRAGEAYVSTVTGYSVFLEYGTSRAAAQPFMRPSADQHGKRAIAAVTRQLRKALKP